MTSSSDLRKKRDAYFASLVARAEGDDHRARKKVKSSASSSSASKVTTKATDGTNGTTNGTNGTIGTNGMTTTMNATTNGTTTTTTTTTVAIGRARGIGVKTTKTMALSDGKMALEATKAKGERRSADADVANDLKASHQRGQGTITGIPREPEGDPCDLDLTKHDGRRFAKFTVPREAEPGSEVRAQIFPNGPIVRVVIPRNLKCGDTFEFAVEPWTPEDVPPKPPGGVDADDEEVPPPPLGAPPATWATLGVGVPPPPPPGRFGAVRPPPPPGRVFPMGYGGAPPPPPGSP